MSEVRTMNGHLFIRPIADTKEVGGLEMITKIDEQNRYSKAEVVFATDPLKCCDIILYDKANGHGYQHEDELLTVLHVSNVIGVL